MSAREIAPMQVRLRATLEEKWRWKQPRCKIVSRTAAEGTTSSCRWREWGRAQVQRGEAGHLKVQLVGMLNGKSRNHRREQNGVWLCTETRWGAAGA
jgi:hypothetical protein